MKNKQTDHRRLSQLSWEFAPNIPTLDFFEQCKAGDDWDLDTAVDEFVGMLENGEFLTWEAVMCEEQGIPLDKRQKKVLHQLIDFGGSEEDDQILYIDEIPRPSQPWYVVLNAIVPRLLIEPYRTSDIQDEAKCDGWREITNSLQEHGLGLSLPPGVESVEQVVPVDLSHKLWLQYCLGNLGGLGQDDDLTLENPEQHFRIESFAKALRSRKETIAYFGLSLESLLAKIKVPEKDERILIEMMTQHLGLKSSQEPITDRL